MTDFLALAYPWTKSLHIIAVISWMAGIFYLPRLLVHHTERVGMTGETHDLFAMMEYKLAHVIMGPAMLATWFFGLCLVFTPGIVDWSLFWPWTKMLSVLGMSAFHIWLERCVGNMQRGKNTVTGRRYRIMNEVPTVLMIVIVISVVVKF
jgi:putative membrane protein